MFESCKNLALMNRRGTDDETLHLLDRFDAFNNDLGDGVRIKKISEWTFPDGHTYTDTMLAYQSPKGDKKAVMGYFEDTLNIRFVQGVKGSDVGGDEDTDGYNVGEYLLRHYLRKARPVIMEGDELRFPIFFMRGDKEGLPSKKLRSLYFRKDGVLSLEKVRTREVLGL